MNIHSICVCGAGTMGSGIAQVAAQSGFKTILYDLNENVLARARTAIEKNLSSIADKGKITPAQKDEILQRIVFANELDNCRAELFIEAIIETMEAKVALFNQLTEISAEETIFASNTSSLSITSIAQQIKRPGRLIGMHFFNPATIMKLVEIVNTQYTHPGIQALVVVLVQKWGKVAVVCKDSPGFIVNRVARPYYIEALRLAEQGVISYEKMDMLLESLGFKMGPFKLMDLIGNDVNYAVSCSVYDQLGRPDRLKPSYIQKQKVGSGELGKKTGKGYYPYN